MYKHYQGSTRKARDFTGPKHYTVPLQAGEYLIEVFRSKWTQYLTIIIQDPPAASITELPHGAPLQSRPSLQTTARSPSVDPLCQTIDDPDKSDEEFGDDEYAPLMRDGIGLDIGQDDEDEEGGVIEGANTTRTGSTRRPLPEWLMSLFNHKLAESERRENGLPPLYYHHQSFWFPRVSTFFLLKHTTCTPAEFFNPQFFLWYPISLCKQSGIPCPNCKTPLQRHGPIHRPRRCIGMESPFWIIGYRYRCSQCRHPHSQKNTVTFCSWDSRILSVLPRALALEFPAILSHRSGLSKETFGVMRTCFQNGMGPKQFSDALLVQHLRRYDMLHLQYLHSVIVQNTVITRLFDRTFKAFPPFDDTSINGYNGFIPSAQWLRDTYDQFVESHQHELNQHTALLTANICAIDHSHKVSHYLFCIPEEKLIFFLIFSRLQNILQE